MGKFVGCNKRSALHRMVWGEFIRRNALRLLTPYGVCLTCYGVRLTRVGYCALREFNGMVKPNPEQA